MYNNSNNNNNNNNSSNARSPIMVGVVPTVSLYMVRMSTIATVVVSEAQHANINFRNCYRYWLIGSSHNAMLHSVDVATYYRNNCSVITILNYCIDAPLVTQSPSTCCVVMQMYNNYKQQLSTNPLTGILESASSQLPWQQAMSGTTNHALRPTAVCYHPTNSTAWIQYKCRTITKVSWW